MYFPLFNLEQKLTKRVINISARVTTTLCEVADDHKNMADKDERRRQRWSIMILLYDVKTLTMPMKIAHVLDQGKRVAVRAKMGQLLNFQTKNLTLKQQPFQTSTKS